MENMGQNVEWELMTESRVPVVPLSRHAASRKSNGRFQQITSDLLDDLMSRDSFAQLKAMHGRADLKAA